MAVRQIFAFISLILFLSDVNAIDGVVRSDLLNKSPLNDDARKYFTPAANSGSPSGAYTEPGPQNDAAIDIGDESSDSPYPEYISIWTDDTLEVIYNINEEYTVFSGILGLGKYAEEDCDNEDYVNKIDEQDENGNYYNVIAGDAIVTISVGTGRSADWVEVFSAEVEDFGDVYPFEVNVAGNMKLRIKVDDKGDAACIGATIVNPLLTNGNCERDGRVIAGHVCECQSVSDCNIESDYCHALGFVIPGANADYGIGDVDIQYCPAGQVCCCSCDDCRNWIQLV